MAQICPSYPLDDVCHQKWTCRGRQGNIQYSEILLIADVNGCAMFASKVNVVTTVVETDRAVMNTEVCCP